MDSHTHPTLDTQTHKSYVTKDLMCDDPNTHKKGNNFSSRAFSLILFPTKDQKV